MRRILHVLLLPLGVSAAIGLAACGGDDEPQRAATAAPPATQTTAARTTAAATTPPTTTAPPTTATTTPTAPSGGAPASTTPSSGGASATTPTTTRPAGGGGAAGCAEAVGGFIRDVRASGTDCAVAGEVAGAWFDAIDAGQPPDAPITAAGFACAGTLAGQVASVTCRGKGGSVTFTASP